MTSAHVAKAYHKTTCTRFAEQATHSSSYIKLSQLMHAFLSTRLHHCHAVDVVLSRINQLQYNVVGLHVQCTHSTELDICTQVQSDKGHKANCTTTTIPSFSIPPYLEQIRGSIFIRISSIS